MTKEDLQKIIDQFNKEELKQDGIFGISQYGGGSNESFIRANKEGLELFALELLKSARDIEATLSDKEKCLMPFVYDENWVDENSETFIHYIEPLADKQTLKQKVDHKLRFADRLGLFGCLIFALVLVGSILVGFFTILGWFF